MNTYALGLGVDGVLTYEPSYDKVPKVGGDFYNLITGVTSGCPWNGGGAYVWPDAKTSDTSTTAHQSRVDDLWHAAINGHGKYFAASDADQVVDGLRSSAQQHRGQDRRGRRGGNLDAEYFAKTDNDIFSDTFTTVRWYGELSDKKMNDHRRGRQHGGVDHLG